MKWSAMIFLFAFILFSFISTVPFDCEFYSYVSEVLSFNFYRSTSWRFDDDGDLIKKKACTLYEFIICSRLQC